MRVQHRPKLLAILRERLGRRTEAELSAMMEEAGLPFAPIRKPDDLFDDEHLLATGALADIRLPDGPRAGDTVKTSLLPITLAGDHLGVRLDPALPGQHTEEVFR